MDSAGKKISSFAGIIGASLSKLNDFNIDPDAVSRITSAIKNHGATTGEVLSKLPGELEKLGTTAVEKFLNGGDPQGKHWSHIESQHNSPHLAKEASNAIFEDGSTNIRRGSADMTWTERIQASADNHIDALLAAAQTPEFWQRTLGNAIEASVYTAAITAVDQLLLKRDLLLNSSSEERKSILLEIINTSYIMAAGAIPLSIFLAIALMIIPGLTMVMAPLGLLGSAGLGLRLINSIVRHPSRQELVALDRLKSFLKDAVYDWKRDTDGNLTITVQATNVSTP